ncbi:MAG: Gfo/Idh/MocA family oxidoreductase [Bacteroidales bacterium]|nr:Gfo/Idh/MocA family oxidoreductase [Bacteroidales bacterium]
MKTFKLALLGTGFISDFYTGTIHGQRSGDRVHIVYSRTEAKASEFARKWEVPEWTTDIHKAVSHPDIDAVLVGLPNHRHLEAVKLAAEAGKAVLCTKPLGRTAAEAREMLEAVESAGVFHGYLEDLVYTHKTMKALNFVRNGALGDILWVRSRETHPGPHSDWFWNKKLSGGGAIVDMGCHCIEIGRNFIGKDIRPVEVMCWADTQVKPIEAEDHGIGLVKYNNGAIGQFEVSWNFRGGMDLRDEVSGVEGTIRMDHFLRTGFEIFTATGESGYVAEKAESQTGWLFPIGDETGALGYDNMFLDMFNALEKGKPPMEDFYDGYVVNAIIDAAYHSAESKKWEKVELEIWRGQKNAGKRNNLTEYDENHWLVKKEKLPNAVVKLILKEKSTGKIIQREIRADES